jgi:hypothetical protein
VNRLYLYHRPTERYTLVATRRSFGWVPAGTPQSLHRSLSVMMQAAANGLTSLPPSAHQDDWMVLLDEASGAPYAYGTFGLNEVENIVLDPVIRFGSANGGQDESLLSLRRTLRAVLTPEAEVQALTDPGRAGNLKAIERLKRENDELRAGVTILAELVAINAARLGMETLEQASCHASRGDWALAWVRAQNWVTDLAARVRKWA